MCLKYHQVKVSFYREASTGDCTDVSVYQFFMFFFLQSLILTFILSTLVFLFTRIAYTIVPSKNPSKFSLLSVWTHFKVSSGPGTTMEPIICSKIVFAEMQARSLSTTLLSWWLHSEFITTVTDISMFNNHKRHRVLEFSIQPTHNPLQPHSTDLVSLRLTTSNAT